MGVAGVERGDLPIINRLLCTELHPLELPVGYEPTSRSLRRVSCLNDGSVQRQLAEMLPLLLTHWPRGQRGGPAAHVILEEDPMLDAGCRQAAAERDQIILGWNGCKNKVRLIAADEIAASCDTGMAGLDGLVLDGNVLAHDDVDVLDGILNLQHDEPPLGIVGNRRRGGKVTHLLGRTCLGRYRPVRQPCRPVRQRLLVLGLLVPQCVRRCR